MKKIFAVVLSVVMMLSLCTVLANAVYLSGAAEGSWVTSEDDFTPVGDIKVQWDPDAASKIVFDGDMSEWQKYNMTEIGPQNMASWAFGNDGMPQNWSIKTYFVADPNGLYVGFYITDDKVAVGTNAAGYSGDAFQIAFDFGYLLGHALETDPDSLTNIKDIFYSFCLAPEGTETLQIMRQESDNDGLLSKDGEEEFNLVDGATAKTEEGWCAEFFISWSRLYFDADYKSWGNGTLKVGVGKSQPLEIGCSLYYLNRDEDDGAAITWAAGTVKGLHYTNADGEDTPNPSVSWSAYDDGVHLILDYVDGMTFNEPGIVVLAEDETGGLVVDTSVTEAPTEPKTEKPTEAKTEAPTEANVGTEAPTEAATKAEKSGCKSVIGGSIALILTAAAAAVALKKH